MLKVRSRIAGFNPSTAVWTQHAKPAIWHAQIWNLLTQTIPGVFQKLTLVAAIELFGSWGFKFPTRDISDILGVFVRISMISIDIYIYISIDITWSIEKPDHFDTRLVSGSTDQIIRSVSQRPRCGQTGEMLALQKGPVVPRWCQGDGNLKGKSSHCFPKSSQLWVGDEL